MTKAQGRLTVVGTPIGNLGDLSKRALDVLGQADVVACEDTRRAGRLFELAGISDETRRPRFLRCDANVEHVVAREIVELVRAGQQVALISDAGMPGVSDPGAVAVGAVAAAGLEVDVVPGPSAVGAALAMSGFDAARYVFWGFLERTGSARRASLAAIASDRKVHVVFEAPGRIVKLVEGLAEMCDADRPVVICRELTKLHQSVWRGVLGSAEDFSADPGRGEFVVVIGPGGVEPVVDDESLVAALSEAVEAGQSLSSAAGEIARQNGVSRRRVYELGIRFVNRG